ncbi:MAG: hypothetical protein J2P28_22955, partial [Actinobacteria bacterium]|nr:hypothetical protein [Actinomycetota bacterium]
MATTRGYEPDLYAGDALDTWSDQEEAADPYAPSDDYYGYQPRRAKRVDEWMDVEFKFGGSRIKRKVVALVLLGSPGVVPIAFILPALFTV